MVFERYRGKSCFAAFTKQYIELSVKVGSG